MTEYKGINMKKILNDLHSAKKIKKCNHKN